MRVSTEQKDRGFAAFMEYGWCEIRLNGRIVPLAIVADEEAGIVKVPRRRRDGTYYLRKDASDFLFRTRKGRVTITPLGWPED